MELESPLDKYNYTANICSMIGMQAHETYTAEGVASAQWLHPCPTPCLLCRYFATGSADALVSLWDCDELVCIRTFSRLEWVT